MCPYCLYTIHRILDTWGICALETCTNLANLVKHLPDANMLPTPFSCWDLLHTLILLHFGKKSIGDDSRNAYNAYNGIVTTRWPQGLLISLHARLSKSCLKSLLSRCSLPFMLPRFHLWHLAVNPWLLHLLHALDALDAGNALESLDWRRCVVWPVQLLAKDMPCAASNV